MVAGPLPAAGMCMQKALELSDGQKKDLMTARHFCLTSLGNLLHERQQLVSTLQVHISHERWDLPAPWLRCSGAVSTSSHA